MLPELTRVDRFILVAAVVAAPLFWLMAFLYWQPPFDPGWPFDDLRRFLFLVVFVPAIEELCFRGVLQPYLLSKTTKTFCRQYISLANLLTSALFAAMHLLQHSLLWSIATFIPSLLFGWLRERTGRTWPAAAMHVYFNFGFFYFLDAL